MIAVQSVVQVQMRKASKHSHESDLKMDIVGALSMTIDTFLHAMSIATKPFTNTHLQTKDPCYLPPSPEKTSNPCISGTISSSRGVGQHLCD